MRISPVILTGMLLTLSVGGPIQAHQEPAANSSSPKGSSSTVTAATAAPATDTDYKIGPQDVLRIDVWKEPDISRIAPVRPDGRISVPLLNDVQAAGQTPAQLAATLTEGLRKFITNPQVTVSVSEINSRRVYVTGEVTKPGAFPLLPNMTVLQALSSSGGFSQFAKIKGIYVLRVEDGKQVKHPFNYKDVVSGKKPELNIPLQPGDVIVVP
jgi:polysaccharide export outer membrane protein